MTGDRSGGLDRQRIDKWLWHARLAKTRPAAQALATSGHVRVNRERNELASRPVKIGDVLTVALERVVRVLKVKAFAERRGSPAVAATLYEDLAPPEPVAPRAPPSPGADSGRPDKHDRRLRSELKRGPPNADRDDFSSDDG